MTTTPAPKKSFPWATAILVAVLIGLPALACLCSVGVGLTLMQGETPSLAATLVTRWR